MSEPEGPKMVIDTTPTNAPLTCANCSRWFQGPFDGPAWGRCRMMRVDYHHEMLTRADHVCQSHKWRDEPAP